MFLPLLLFLVVYVQFAVGQNGGMFKQLEHDLLNHRFQQARQGLTEAFLDRVEDKPKEIEIFCPGEPIVTIKDLVNDAANAFDGQECMVLKLTGHNFNFRLALNCDEVDSANMKFNNFQQTTAN